jgi:signal peptidase I
VNDPAAPAQPRLRRRHPWRDTIEGLLSAAALVLIIRHFAFEVFKIPTGSMAPTLLGQHRDVVCPNCGYRYIVDGGAAGVYPQGVRCPNCWYNLDAQKLGLLHCSCFPSWPQRLFWQGGNRVIVNKFLSRIRPLRRWEVVVFRWPYVLVHCRSCGHTESVSQDAPLPVTCPACGGPVSYERQNYIKRLVGLPDEELTIWHGDIYINGLLQRKPPEVQEAVWQHVYDSKYVPVSPVRGAAAVWHSAGGNDDPHGALYDFCPRWRAEAGKLQENGARLTLTPDAAGVARAHYLAPITDYAPYNQWPPAKDLYPVGDLRWSVEVRLDAPGLLRLGIEEDGRPYTAVIRFGDVPGQTALNVGGETVSRSDFAAEPGRTVRLSFANADDRLELKIAGRLVLSHNMDVPFDKVPDGRARSNGAWLEVEGARADFARVRLQRDLYYIVPGGGPSVPASAYHVDPGSYFAMGDNTRNSSDGRYWGSFPERNVIGIGSVVWWPLNQVRACR